MLTTLLQHSLIDSEVDWLKNTLKIHVYGFTNQTGQALKNIQNKVNNVVSAWTKELSKLLQDLATQKGVHISKKQSDLKAEKCKYSFADEEFSKIYHSVESPPGYEECSSGAQLNEHPRVESSDPQGIPAFPSTSTSQSAPMGCFSNDGRGLSVARAPCDGLMGVIE